MKARDIKRRLMREFTRISRAPGCEWSRKRLLPLTFCSGIAGDARRRVRKWMLQDASIMHGAAKKRVLRLRRSA